MLGKKGATVMNAQDEFGTLYTQTNEFKLNTFEISYQFAVTPGGTDKPFSAFLNFNTGLFWGKQKQADTRYGDNENPFSKFMVGAGATFYGRLGSHFLVFAEPTYEFDLFSSTPVYVADYSRIKFSNIRAIAGIAFLIGKSE